MDQFVPTKIFLTKGFGSASTQLGAFEYALRDAGIAPFNLVKVSSIVPPNAEIISKEEGLKALKRGQILFLVLSRIESNEPGRKLVASIGMAVPKERSNYGYIAEYEAFDESKEVASEKAESLAITMLATALGYLEKERISEEESENVLMLKSRLANTLSISEEVTVKGNGWTCAIAAAVLL
ncbi:MAG: pyruvoyl-dependent arginine decarboxylase [Candidatus Micrarchaeia archaeon]